jgi:hypothetical protein
LDVGGDKQFPATIVSAAEKAALSGQVELRHERQRPEQ